MRITSVVLALLVAAGLYVWIMDRAPSNAGAAEEARTPVAEHLTSGDRPVAVIAMHSAARQVETSLVLRGRTEADRRVDVRAETEGLVASAPIRKGARVNEGDLLCKLDPGSRNAELAEARAKLAEAKAQNDVTARLTERGFAAETTAIARRAALEAAKAALDRMELDIDRLSIRAPFDGVLESDTAEIGSLMRKGDVCAIVIALDPIKIVGFVPETDVDKLRVGGPATARLINGREVSGRITFVARSADPATRTFEVEVRAPNPDGAIRDGLTAETVIPLDSGVGHFLPQAALTLNDAGQIGVRTVEDGAARFAAVDIIRDEADGVWVRGLPDEADVIVVGQEYVADGRPVAPTFTDGTDGP